MACLLLAACGGPARPPAPGAAPSVAGPSSSPVPPPSPSASPSVSLAPLPDGFVALSDVDSSILSDIRYSTAHNFVGRPVTGYLRPRCLLTREAADALHRVQRSALARGYSLKVYDCYRPQQAV